MNAKTEPFDYVRDWNQRLSAKGWWHSFELPDGTFIDGVCQLPELKNRIGQFPIPADLRGKRVLDIGAWDGWFSFEMERRGAEVMAIDCWDNPRFHEMHSLVNSRIDYRQMDVYELNPNRIGRFDIVLFMGVLYHLKHPLLALEKVCSVTRGMAAVDSFILKEAHRPGAGVDQRPLMEFYETDEFGGQTDNWVGPSLPCLLAFCRTAGFARVEHLETLPYSACVACYREWNPPPASPAPAPEVSGAFHHVNFGINFNSLADDYLVSWFKSAEKQLAIEDVMPEVGGYGVRPIHVGATEAGGFEATFKLPPGLDPGWHDVRLRVKDSAPSAPHRIAVDVPLESNELIITGLADGQTWTADQIDLAHGDSLALWVRGLPENADRNNVKVSLEARRVPVKYVEPATGQDTRQINVQIPDFAPAGSLDVTVECGSRSAPRPITILK